MKNVLMIFGAVLIVVCLPMIFLVMHDARVETYTQAFTGITTGAAETTSNATLALALYDNSITSVTGISSNITGDLPTASGYNSVSKFLDISGLVVSQTRTLSIDYEIDSTVLSEFPSASAFLSVFVYLIIFGILGVIAGAIYGMFRSTRG